MGSMLTYRDHIFVAGGMCPSPLDLTGNSRALWMVGRLLTSLPCEQACPCSSLLAFLPFPLLPEQPGAVCLSAKMLDGQRLGPHLRS